MHRPIRPSRLVRALLCVSAPVALAAGCSSAPASDVTSSPVPSSAGPSPSVRYAALPDPCKALSHATVVSLVPGTKKAGGAAADSGEPDSRSGCSWNGLHGYQYRFLDIAFQRFDNGAQSADDQAAAAYDTTVQTAALAAKTGKKAAHTGVLAGIGQEAGLITWDTTKDHAVYHNATVVTRVANTVVTVDYTGAGLQGAHSPKAATVQAAARRAATEAVTSLG